MKRFIKGIPLAGDIVATVNRKLNPRAPSRLQIPFESSADYWKKRYASGGNSGIGSYEHFAEFKAEVLNAFVLEHSIGSIIEFGSGDGNQLSLAQYPAYKGFDISPVAIERCRERFASDPTKSFSTLADYKGEKAELALSLDVIFHLVENAVFETYMRTLFAASMRYVIVYSSDMEVEEDAPHVRHRKFTKWIDANVPQWTLSQHIPNRYPYEGDWTKGSFADFFVYHAL